MKFLRINLIVLLNSFFIFILASCAEKEPTKLAEDTRPTIAVEIAKVGNDAQASFNSVSGKIQAEDFVTVSSRTMGYITNVEAKVGDQVISGQTLVSVENNDVKSKIPQVDAQILEIKTSISNIEKDYNRILSLFNKKSTTQKELDDITTQRDRMKAKLKEAEAGKREIENMLTYSEIKAPMSGVITEKWVQTGDLATPGKPLFTIESSNRFQAEAMIPESGIGKINKGDKVDVIIKSSGEKIKGKISQINQSAKNTGGQYLVKIDLNKNDIKNIKLFSGMFATILLSESKTKNIENKKIIVQEKAIVRHGQLTGVYTLGESNTALLRWVRLGKRYNDEVEVLSGLALGENYISEKEGRLSDGIKVEVKNNLTE